MRGQPLHSWRVTVPEAQQIQRELASQVSRRNELPPVRLIAGVDISAGDWRGVARGAVMVLRYPELSVAEKSVVEGRVDFPYVPGLLSFRESPVILSAFERLSLIPDLVLVDGQGIAHPRRMGIASHLGLLLDVATIGCAKSILCGRHGPLGAEVGSYAPLEDDGEVIGAALRTRAGVSPIYVSIGHKVDLEVAIAWVVKCCRGYRLPEPTRLAHLAAAGHALDAGRTRPRVSLGVEEGQQISLL